MTKFFNTKINFLSGKFQKIKKAKSEHRLTKAIVRRLVPKTYLRLKNALYHQTLSKGAQNDRSKVCFTLQHKSYNYFGINLPLIKLDNEGKFVFPKGTKRVMIDVGTSTDWPNSTAWLNRHPNDSVVIGIEPNIDSWCVAKALHLFADELELLGRGAESNYIKQNHTHRIFFLPVAIGNFQGYVPFNSNKSAGTSSILASNPANLDPETAALLETRHQNLVPVIKLDEVLKRIPEYIEYIEHLKVDAEGFDFEVIKSAGDLIKRCAVVTVEISAYSAFVHSYIVKDMIKYIKTKGFREIAGSRGVTGTVSFINLKYENILSDLDYKVRN